MVSIMHTLDKYSLLFRAVEAEIGTTVILVINALLKFNAKIANFVHLAKINLEIKIFHDQAAGAASSLASQLAS